MDFSQAYSNTHSSVINVLELDQNNRPISSGTGVLIGDGSKALTCEHCVSSARADVYARFSGQGNGTKASILATDAVLDLAVIEFHQSLGSGITFNLTPVNIGEEAFVVGFPAGIMTLTALSANVAGIERENNVDYIRIDSSVNHGSSGGPLFSPNGELIGIVNAKHGNLSTFLNQMQNLQTGVTMSLGGFNPVQVIQQLIGEMKRNLNLGIGYAIPMDAVNNFLIANNVTP